MLHTILLRPYLTDLCLTKSVYKVSIGGGGEGVGGGGAVAGQGLKSVGV